MKHQRSSLTRDGSTQADIELMREMDEYLDLYRDEEQIDGMKRLPARGGRHAKEEG